MTAANLKGESEFTGMKHQYAAHVPVVNAAPELIDGSRT
jgi:hypothetical protein